MGAGASVDLNSEISRPLDGSDANSSMKRWRKFVE